MYETFTCALFLGAIALFYRLAFLLTRAGNPKRETGSGSGECESGFVDPSSRYRGPIYHWPHHHKRRF